MSAKPTQLSATHWRRAARAVGFAAIAFAMPALFLTCDRPGAASERCGVLPAWNIDEWWEVEATVAVQPSADGTPLSGVDVRHRFEVVAEETVSEIACWRVEARPINPSGRRRESEPKRAVARIWVSKAGFQPMRVEVESGRGREFLDPPFHQTVAEAPEPRPLLFANPAPTVLDLPLGPRHGEKHASDWQRAATHENLDGGAPIRQTIHVIVENDEHLVCVTLSDGAAICHQVWRPGRPWPDSLRAWAGESPEPPFAYKSEVKRWSREPYRGYVGAFFLVFGFAAQGMFTMRFILQWIASEKAGRSVIPMAFWHCSLVGGLMLLTYAIYRLDPVFILGQSFGSFVYIRNVYLRMRERKELAKAADEAIARKGE